MRVSFAVDMMTKAAESAATFIAMEPSDEVMANNIRYYTTQSKVPPETFVPRQVQYVGRPVMRWTSHTGKIQEFQSLC